MPTDAEIAARRGESDDRNPSCRNLPYDCTCKRKLCDVNSAWEAWVKEKPSRAEFFRPGWSRKDPVVLD